MEEVVNTNIFPAKLWRLVNSPGIGAIRWDSHGELVVIDQSLFQSQILSAGIHRDVGFKTTNFSSFIRQLNLYGFKKKEPTMIQGVKDGSSYHFFYNSNFKRNHPELLVNLQRLTAKNKARIQAGLDVKRRYSSLSVEIGEKSQKRKSSPPPPARLQSPPYHPDQGQDQKPQTRTPVPPQYMVGGQRGVPFFTPAQHIPVSLRHQYSGGSFSSMQVRQGLLNPANRGNPPFIRFNPQTAQYKPLYYPSVCQCCNLNVKPKIPNLQTELFSPPRLYQDTVNQEVKKFDINVDTIFQFVDEMMQASPTAQMVQVQTPKDPVSVLKPSPGSFKATPHENDTSTTSIGMPVSVVVSRVQTDKDEDSVTSVPKQIPPDAIFEDASDQEKDAEIVEVGDPAGDTSQKSSPQDL